MAKSNHSKKPVKKGVVKPKPRSKKKKKDDDCFITTACVKHFGLDDNCYELQTLRKFRDEYLLVDKKRGDNVIHYYSIAPTIVELLNESKESKKHYKFIFNSIKDACNAIEIGDLKQAEMIYTATVKNLCIKFKLI